MKHLIISGPTASGKSGAAMKLAEILGNVEIISADAFQVYKGLNIGTAKVSQEERLAVPHHLIDIMEPWECYTAGLFSKHAERLVGEVVARGNIPIVVGGTGLYIKSLACGIFDCPPISPHVRKELYLRLERDGLISLYNDLKVRDPEYAARISPNDPVRIVRALEVAVDLGLPFTEAHKKYISKPAYEYGIYVLAPERSILYDGINKRTEAMWQAGWPLETAALLESGVKEDCPAFRAIGYGETAEYVKNGGCEADVICEIAKQTRHFAKRQLTWFRGMDGVRFYEEREKLLADAVAFCLSKGD